MTSTGWLILISYTAISAVGVVIVLSVFRSTRAGFHAIAADREAIERREARWTLVVGAFLAIVLLLTIFQTPYFRATAKSGTRVKIVGQQFAWTIDPPRVKLGTIVAEIRSRDVAHGIGIYDPDGVLVKQVNASPGVTQRLEVTLNRTGTYSILCMEFCGIDHHKMRNTLEVTR